MESGVSGIGLRSGLLFYGSNPSVREPGETVAGPYRPGQWAAKQVIGLVLKVSGSMLAVVSPILLVNAVISVVNSSISAVIGSVLRVCKAILSVISSIPPGTLAMPAVVPARRLVSGPAAARRGQAGLAPESALAI